MSSTVRRSILEDVGDEGSEEIERVGNERR